MVNPPVVAGVNPVTALIDALGVKAITSVLATFAADIVRVAQAVEAMDPKLFSDPAPLAAVVPFAINCANVAEAGMLVELTEVTFGRDVVEVLMRSVVSVKFVLLNVVHAHCDILLVGAGNNMI